VDSSIIVKLNRVALKHGMREKATRKFNEFFATIQGKEKGFKGFMILENEEDSHETLVLTLWNSKGDMDNYYSNTNKRFSGLVDEVKPMFEKMPERITYNVASLDLSN
jgi:heme-degrading monooxygenase HmoA